MLIVHHDTKNRSSVASTDNEPIRSLIPARLDRLGWSRFHTMVVVALGVAWVLDGLEITIASNVTTLISKPAGAEPLFGRRLVCHWHRVPPG